MAKVSKQVTVQNLRESMQGQWTVDVNGDWVPGTDGDGIGSLDASPAFVSIGNVATLGNEGLIAANSDTNGGGISIIGFRNEAPAPGSEPNAPVIIAGNVVLLDAGTLGVISDQAITEDHYLIMKPTTTLANGDFFSPLVQGPRVVYVQSETATDATNRLLVVTVAQEVVTIDAVGTFPVDSQIDVEFLIEETTARTVDVTVDIKQNTVIGFTETFQLSGSRITYSRSVNTVAVISPTDTISVEVTYTDVGGGPARTVRVRGDVQATRITLLSVT